MPSRPAPPHIGTLKERTLHAQLKKMYLTPGALTEVRVRNYVADVLQADGRVVEIQTGGFASLRTKLPRLLETHPVRLVYPVAVERQIVLLEPDSRTVLSKRKSPKRGSLFDAGEELYWIAPVLASPRFEFELLLIKEQELRYKDGRGSWRRKGVSIHDRLLLEITERRLFAAPMDYDTAFLPASLPEKFTNKELAAACGIPVSTAWRITSFLRGMGRLAVAETMGREHVYARTASPPEDGRLPVGR